MLYKNSNITDLSLQVITSNTIIPLLYLRMSIIQPMGQIHELLPLSYNCAFLVQEISKQI